MTARAGMTRQVRKFLATFVLISTISFLLTSCGFHLRGESETSVGDISPLYIQSKTPYGDFEKKLRRLLDDYHVVLTDDPMAAKFKLVLINTNLTQSSGITSASMSTQQYTLTYSATFELDTAKGKQVTPPQTVQSLTTFTASTPQIINMNSFTAPFQESLQNDVAFRLVSVLNADRTQAAVHALSDTKPHAQQNG
jgi:outer membrane lipopolysaccharide assembly protein LptE/RlpB